MRDRKVLVHKGAAVEPYGEMFQASVKCQKRAELDGMLGRISAMLKLDFQKKDEACILN